MLAVLRRFWIHAGAFEEFARISAEEIWPEIEAVGARVQGLYLAESPEPHPDAPDDCQMAVLVTAYRDHDHWRATRAGQDTWAGSEAGGRRMAAAVRKRHALTFCTEPTFMRPADVDVGGPYAPSL